MSEYDSTFKNREEAGQLLAEELLQYAAIEDVLVLGLPRGGAPVAFEVAKALEASLEILLVRKLGTPGQEELAMGAITSGGIRVLNEEVIRRLGIGPDVVERVTLQEQAELDRRETLYRGTRPPLRIVDRTVILVDDGIATGSTMRAAIDLLRTQKAGSIVVAAPTAAPEAVRDLSALADAVVTVMTPEHFLGVGRWYQDFTQVEDHEVRRILETDEMGSPDPAPEDPFIFTESDKPLE